MKNKKFLVIGIAVLLVLSVILIAVCTRGCRDNSERKPISVEENSEQSQTEKDTDGKSGDGAEILKDDSTNKGPTVKVPTDWDGDMSSGTTQGDSKQEATQNKTEQGTTEQKPDGTDEEVPKDNVQYGHIY